MTGQLSSQYCTFKVDGLNFGVSVTEVQEVLRQQRMTRVPRAPHAVHGLINLRGQIVVAVDMRSQLGFPARTDDGGAMNVIVRSRGEVVSLLVDDIGDVMDIGGAAIEPAPSTLPRQVRDVIHGVLTLPSHSILLILNPARAADVNGAHENTGETK